MSKTPSKDSLLIRLRGYKKDDLCVCIPHAGSGISTFNKWPALLGDEFWLALVQLPGREDRLSEPLQRDSFAIATEIAEEVHLLGPHRIFLYGHSMGAFLAWLTATILWQKYGRVVIVILAAQSPTFRIPKFLSDRRGLQEWFVRMGEPWPDDLSNPEVRDLFLRVLNQDLCWLSHQKRYFSLDQSLPISLHCVYGESDGLVDRHAMSSWAQVTSRNFSLTCVRGGHLFLLRQPSIITEHIKRVLAIERQNGNLLHS